MNEYIAKIKEWWTRLSVREKQVVALGGSALILILFYVLIWSPYLERVDALRKKVVAQQKTLQWMKTAIQEIKRLEAESTEAKAPTSPVVLLAYLQKQVTEAGLESALSALKQADNEAVKMQFQEIDFDKFMQLILQVAKEQPVSIAQLSVKAENDPGMVGAEITFKVE